MRRGGGEKGGQCKGAAALECAPTWPGARGGVSFARAAIYRTNPGTAKQTALREASAKQCLVTDPGAT